MFLIITLVNNFPQSIFPYIKTGIVFMVGECDVGAAAAFLWRVKGLSVICGM